MTFLEKLQNEKLYLSAVTGAAFLAALPVAEAQDQSKEQPAAQQDRGGGEQGKGQDKANLTKDPTNEKSTERQEKEGLGRGADKKGDGEAARGAAAGEGQDTSTKAKDDGAERDTPKKAEKDRVKGDKPSSDEAAGQQKDTTKERTSEDKVQKDRPESATESWGTTSGEERTRREGTGPADRERNTSATDQDRTRDQAGEGQRRDGQVTEEGRRLSEKVRSEVDDKSRTRIREVVSRHGSDYCRTDVDISVGVGVTLPRSVEIYDVPPEIIEIVPAYRGYRYIVVRDEFVVVDPDTYVFIDVIPWGGHRANRYTGGGSARLHLSDTAIRIIRDEVDRAQARAEFRGELEVGIALPGDVRLVSFPDRVVREVPEVRDYQYTVIQEDIVIVEPDDHDVVFVIDG